MMRSWSEMQSMAEQAALGAGVPFSQAARFGAAAARHLGEERPADAIDTLLDAPDRIVAFSLEIERAIEAASLTQAPYEISEQPHMLVASFLQSLPCGVRIEPVPGGLSVTVLLQEPQRRSKSARIDVPDALWAKMETLAARTYVPESDSSRERGAGARLMQLD